MKLFMVFLRDELRGTFKTEKSALAEANSLRRSYWPKITIVETSVPLVRTVKTFKADPEPEWSRR